MLYKSTRGHDELVPASVAILRGLAPDGGLYVPESIPSIQLSYDDLTDLSYQELAYDLMAPLLSDFSEIELKECINRAYDTKFTSPDIAPVVKSGDDYYLELFHGPTLAFKDMALSILPHLMTVAAKKQDIDKEIVILTATSGDTGKAAMEGFADIEGTKIIVFYPKNGVSSIQEKQMLTQTGDNTYVVGITGNFDDAQRHVKDMFNDVALNDLLTTRGQQLSSANSINIGRLIPQMVYYVFAYLQMVRDGYIEAGAPLNVSVPTGNFGNILAAYYMKQMGLPIKTLLCASNKNNVLTDFFKTGLYNKNRPFYVTNSPSMDILVSSNLERLLYLLSGKQSNQTTCVTTWMTMLSEEGEYQLSEAMMSEVDDIFASYSDELEIQQTIASVYKQDKRVIDPHTAVAKHVADQYASLTGDKTKTVIVSTASPYKFPTVVLNELGEQREPSDEEMLEAIQKISHVNIPEVIKGLDDAPILHERVIESDDMKQTVLDILNSSNT